MSPVMDLLFPPFRLDLAGQRLWQGEREIRLRPKTFAVLRYLADRPGQLVSIAELLSAVWPGIAVTDVMPRICVRELRAALGDDAQTPRFIETRPGRGYQFVAPVLPLTTVPAGGARGPADQAAGWRPLVGRHAVLRQLAEALERAREGERQVLFVCGEPGIGKTSLVDAFVSGLTAPGIVWAMGECVQQYGAGEPYLPVLTALERLAGRVGDGALIDSMRRTAPDWLAQLPSLVEPAEHAALVRRLGGSTSRHILRELASLLETLAEERVLVLWLEDLHWADHSTLEAVDVLARRSERARLMVVATYRPSELRDSDAPLARLAHDLALHGRGRILTLDRLPEQAVAEYLAVRLPGRPVSARLVRHVHRRSDGNPLFMVTVADDLVNRALVAERDGQWSVDDAGVRRAGDIPDTLRKLIEQQALHLEVDDRCLLEAACVAGVEFSAAAVAAAIGGDQAAVEERCERLSRRGQFLASRPGIDWPDGPAAGYAFVHALHHDVLYESIPAGRRRQLHARIAERLERAFAGRPREAAVELAMHFERARDPRRAVHYHGLAGDVALERAANAEAIAHLSSALEVLKELPEDVERSRLELKLRFALGPALIVSRGYAVPEVERTYVRALELARGHHDAREVTRALRGLWNVYLIAGEFGHARKLATELLARARTSREPGALGVAHAALGETLFHAGELPRARRHLERALALDRRHAVAGRTSQRPRLACYLGWALWLAGYPDRARRLCREGIDEARALARPHSHAFALGYAGRVHQQCGDVSRVEELTEELLAVCRDHDIPWWQAYAEALRGWLLAMRGEVPEATLAMRRAIAAHEQMGSRINVTNGLAVLAEIYCDAGDVEAGWQAVEEALAQAVKTGHRCNESDMYRVRGELLLRRATDGGEAERCLRKAMRLARRRSARSQELRAATSLARMCQSRGQPDRGRRLLAPLCRWFTEGADTADVSAARALLAEISDALRPSAAGARRGPTRSSKNSTTSSEGGCRPGTFRPLKGCIPSLRLPNPSAIRTQLWWWIVASAGFEPAFWP